MLKTVERNPEPNGGLDDDQKSEIRSRKYRATGSGLVSKSDKWKEIYRICFPRVEEPEVSSPGSLFYSHPPLDVSEFEAFLLQSVPDTIREQIRTEINVECEAVAREWS